MLTEATRANLQRKSHWADRVQMREGIPLPSWIDLSLTERCNRRCVFCPRVDESVYPNQNLNMSIKLARKIADELREWKYEGCVVLSGFGEATLHPELVDIVAQFGRSIRVEMVSNGDKLTPPFIEALVAAGVDYFAISLYDGPAQIAPMKERFAKAGCTEEQYILRDRWHDESNDFGLKLTNRAGAVSVGHQPQADASAPCNYVSYSATVDWDGRVLLCVQDWQKRVSFGNLHDQSLWEIWTSKAMHKRRMQLMRGREGLSPCGSCNAGGCAHGDDHVRAWQS